MGRTRFWIAAAALAGTGASAAAQGTSGLNALAECRLAFADAAAERGRLDLSTALDLSHANLIRRAEVYVGALAPFGFSADGMVLLYHGTQGSPVHSLFYETSVAGRYEAVRDAMLRANGLDRCQREGGSRGARHCDLPLAFREAGSADTGLKRRVAEFEGRIAITCEYVVNDPNLPARPGGSD